MKRNRIAVAAVLVGAVVLVAVMFGLLSSAEDRLASLAARNEEVLRLKDEHMALNRRVRRLEGKRNLTPVQGLAHAVDEVFEPLGLKEKVKSLQLLSAREEGEERAEVTVKGADMNETVNFLYAIETTPMPLAIKKLSIRTSFENPERLNITMTLSFIKP